MMQVISNKLTVALRGDMKAIDRIQWDNVQEFLNGMPTTDSKVKKHDSGKPKETTFPGGAGVGPDEIAREDGDRSSMDNTSSGYNRGLNPGGRADDETGPGNTPDADPEQNFTDHMQNELAWKAEGDLSSQYSPLNQDSSKRDQRRINSHMGKMYGMAPIHQRYDRAASTEWKYEYN